MRSLVRLVALAAPVALLIPLCGFLFMIRRRR